MRKCNPWMFLPIMFSVFSAVGLWVVYFIAVEDNKITPLNSEHRRQGSLSPPFISLAGNAPPASCVFSQVMNMAGFVAFIIGVLRYLQMKPKVQKPLVNICSLVAVSVACFGITLVGNFQLANDEELHNIGTSMSFGMGTMFCWIQSVMTFKINLKNEGRRVGILRFLLSGTITLCVFLCILSPIGPDLYPTFISQRMVMHAARTQWALAMFLLAFFSTFAIEFRHYRFEIVCSPDEDPPQSVSDTFSEVSEFQSDQL